MKLPNGYGSVKKLSGKRRNPWIVTKTTGWKLDLVTGKEKQEKIIIGYYPSRKEGLDALAEYNKNPYDINAAKITFSELYEKWSDEKYPTISRSNVHGYKAAYALCRDIYDMSFSEIKLSHLQAVVVNSGKNYPTLRKLKVLFGQVYDYAVMHEVIGKEKHIVEYLAIRDAGNPNARNRTPFTPSEINKVWKNSELNEYVSVILMLIYSGLRISELLDLKKDDVHIEERWLQVTESKTQAGIRSVPIAKKVLPFYEKWMNQFPDQKYLLSTPLGEHFEYRNYYDGYWKPLIEQMDMKHSPHDTRHTCISLLATTKTDPTVIKKIVGHAGAQNITERVYTHFEIQVLIDAIDLI